MNHRLAVPFAALLTLASLLPAASACAEPVPSRGAGTLEIVVGGSPQPRYAHEGRGYVEALKGREYTIRLHNPYPVRVAVALSVDGLNTIDARETTAAAARKWVIEPYDTIEVRGWQTSQSQARRFEFTTEARSYGQALGRTSNLGVIAAVFFKERLAVPRQEFAPPATGSMEQRKSSRPGPATPAPPSAEAQGADGGVADESGMRPDAAADAGAAARRRADNEFAATGMGRTTDHAVSQVFLDLEPVPAHSQAIRYEFRPQLVRLGIVPPGRRVDPLTRREAAQGFCPVVP